jgi:hypothetical protein
VGAPRDPTWVLIDFRGTVPSGGRSGGHQPVRLASG